jgi:hypothetical protein
MIRQFSRTLATSVFIAFYCSAIAQHQCDVEVVDEFNHPVASTIIKLPTGMQMNTNAAGKKTISVDCGSCHGLAIKPVRMDLYYDFVVECPSGRSLRVKLISKAVQMNLVKNLYSGEAMSDQDNARNSMIYTELLARVSMIPDSIVSTDDVPLGLLADNFLDTQQLKFDSETSKNAYLTYLSDLTGEPVGEDTSQWGLVAANLRGMEVGSIRKSSLMSLLEYNVYSKCAVAFNIENGVTFDKVKGKFVATDQLRDVLVRFQRDRNLDATGYVDVKTLKLVAKAPIGEYMVAGGIE